MTSADLLCGRSFSAEQRPPPKREQEEDEGGGSSRSPGGAHLALLNDALVPGVHHLLDAKLVVLVPAADRSAEA